MRGLVTATSLLLAPALAVALSYGSGAAAAAAAAAEKPSDALVTLEVPLGEEDAYGVVSLKLHVDQAEHVCGPANVQINGQPLSLDLAGAGQGVLTVEDGATITASWSLTCIQDDTGPLEQLLSFTVRSLNGEVVPDVTFSSLFRQTYPPAILDVSLGSHMVVGEVMDSESEDSGDESNLDLRDERLGNSDVDDDVPVKPRDSQVHISTTSTPSKNLDDEALRIQVHHLKLLQIQLKSLEKLVNLREAYIRDNFEHGAEYLQHNGIHGSDKPSSTYPPEVSPTNAESSHTLIVLQHDQKERPVMISTPQPTPDHTPHAFTFSQDPAVYFDLVTALVLAAIAFGVFSLCGIVFVHRHLVVRATELRRRRYDVTSGTRRETREERLARRACRREARHQAIRAWFRNRFSFWFGDEEKDAMQREEQQETPAATPSPEDTTMEQELAQFREAAAMVGNLVAAEEGRSERREAAQRAAPPRQQPSFARAAYAGFSDDEDIESLPAYESEPEDADMVADGFYMRPSSEFVTPGRTPTEGFSRQDASDRLGYGK